METETEVKTEKVRITDIETSVKHSLKDKKRIVYGGCVLSKPEPKYVWVGRVDNYTQQELENGKKQNPEVRWMPIEKLCGLMGVEVDERDKGKTAILFPSTNGIHFFMSLCFPAYTKGVKGKYVDVEIELD